MIRRVVYMLGWKWYGNLYSERGYCVGIFPELKHTQFTWFGNLPTPRSYWFVLMKLTNNTNKGGGENLLYSTQALSLSRFSLCVFTLLCVLHTPTLQLFTEHTYILS
jgi:hypothetical protein